MPPISSKGGAVAGAGTVPMSPGSIAMPPDAFKSLFGSSHPNVTTPTLVGGQDPNDVLKEMFKPIDPNIIERAITPVPSGHAAELPPSMTTPVEGFQPYPMNREQVVGAGNARARGIGNAITGVANAIGQVTVAKQQRDQRTLAGSTTRLIQAQQAIDQANEAMTDPNLSPEARKGLEGSIEKNTNVMNDILADDKTRKGIEKGYNISFTDPSKNQTPEHGAVQQGIAEAKKSYAEQFTSKMPQGVSPPQIAQQRLQIAQAQQAAQTASAKATLSYMATMQRLGVAMDITKLKELGENGRKTAELNLKWEMQTRALKTAGELMNFRFKKEFELVGARADAAVTAAEDIWDYKNADKGVIKAKWEASDVKYANAISAGSNAVDSILNNMSLNKAIIDADPVMKKKFEDALKTAQESVLQLTAQREANRKNMKDMFGPKFIGDPGEDGEEGEGGEAKGTTLDMNDIGTYQKEASDIINDITQSGDVNMFGSPF